MIKSKRLLVPFVFLFTLLGCKGKSDDAYVPELTPTEKMLCDSIGVDESTAKLLKEHAKSNLSHLYYSLGKAYQKDGKETIDPTSFLKGVMVNTKNDQSEGVVDELSAPLRAKGYSIFVVENNFNLHEELDRVAIVKDTSIANIIKLIGTDGANYNIGNDSVVAIVKGFAQRYDIQLLGMSGDWLSLRLKGNVSNWNALAEDVFKIAPDVVEQGTGSVSELATELEKSKMIYLWWD